MSKLQVRQADGKLYAQTRTEYVITPDGVSEEYRYLHAQQVDILRQWKHVYPYSSGFGNTANFVYFSDIHGDGVNLQRIVSFWKSLPYEIECICGGDMVAYVPGSTAMDFWNNVQGSDGILMCIGNHDVLSESEAVCYQRYFANNIASWGVIYTPNVCYYYKDYAAQKVRMIVLDCMHWTTAQRDWLVSALAAARTAGYHVICVSHYMPGTGAAMQGCSFDSLWVSSIYLAANIDPEAPAAVQDFIDSGGKFVCWLAGHIHSDVFRLCSAYPQQLMVLVACAGMDGHVGAAAGCQLARTENTKSQDLFDLVSVNTDFSYLSLARVGADYDNFGRHIGSLVYDYTNHELLWSD